MGEGRSALPSLRIAKYALPFSISSYGVVGVCIGVGIGIGRLDLYVPPSP